MPPLFPVQPPAKALSGSKQAQRIRHIEPEGTAMRPRSNSILLPADTRLGWCVLFLAGLAFFAASRRATAQNASSKPVDSTANSTIDEVVAKRKVLAAEIAA